MMMVVFGTMKRVRVNWGSERGVRAGESQS